MMYSEFVAGTGCKDNTHNYKVFTDLEIMYMNSDLTKEQIYEYGKKLVDNSKSPEQIEFEKEINQKIESAKNEIAGLKDKIQTTEWYIKIETDEVYAKMWKDDVKHYKNEIRKLRNEIRALKWVLE